LLEGEAVRSSKRSTTAVLYAATRRRAQTGFQAVGSLWEVENWRDRPWA